MSPGNRSPGVDHSIDADATVDQVVGLRGRQPDFVRCDNGPELTANALRTVEFYVCERCGHEWLPRTEGSPPPKV